MPRGQHSTPHAVYRALARVGQQALEDFPAHQAHGACKDDGLVAHGDAFVWQVVCLTFNVLRYIMRP